LLADYATHSTVAEWYARLTLNLPPLRYRLGVADVAVLLELGQFERRHATLNSGLLLRIAHNVLSMQRSSLLYKANRRSAVGWNVGDRKPHQA